jgi:hypothetical protein
MGFGNFTMIPMWGVNLPWLQLPWLDLYYCVVIMVGVQWDESISKCGHICLCILQTVRTTNIASTCAKCHSWQKTPF